MEHLQIHSTMVCSDAEESSFVIDPDFAFVANWPVAFKDYKDVPPALLKRTRYSGKQGSCLFDEGVFTYGSGKLCGCSGDQAQLVVQFMLQQGTTATTGGNDHRIVRPESQTPFTIRMYSVVTRLLLNCASGVLEVSIKV